MIEAPRDLISKGVIALALCVGGYMMLVSPAKERLVEEREKGAELSRRVEDAEGVRDQVAALTSAFDRVRAETAAFSSMGDLARNERRLYAAVVAAAEKHRVQIDQLTPSKTGAARVSGEDGDVAVGYQLAATGRYADIAGLVRSLQSEFGFTVVRSVSAHPRGNGDVDLVRATIETVHFSFEARRPEQAAGLATVQGDR
jgi:hypothetical protein